MNPFDIHLLAEKRKKKLQAKRRDAFQVELLALEQKHGCFIGAGLKITSNGILPMPTVNAIPQDEYEKALEFSKPNPESNPEPAAPADKPGDKSADESETESESQAAPEAVPEAAPEGPSEEIPQAAEPQAS